MPENALSSFVTALSGIASDVVPLVVTVASSFIAIAAVFIGIRYLLRAAKIVK